MKKIAAYLGAALLTVWLSGCWTLKYEVLKGTSLANPPGAPIKVYIKEFPVDSKASVVEPRAADAAEAQGGYVRYTSDLAKTGNKLTRISRPSRIEDLSGVVLRELRKDKIRIFSQLELIEDLGEENVRQIDNLFELVSATEAQLEISGTALISSQRIRKAFSQQTQSVEVAIEVKDLKTGKVHKKPPLTARVMMTFNSRELEEAMAIAVMTSMTQKLLF
jgi:hypothetical protein